MFGKTAALQDNPATNHRIPVAMEACCAFKTKTFNFEIYYVCLNGHVLAMIKELRERGKSPILS